MSGTEGQRTELDMLRQVLRWCLDTGRAEAARVVQDRIDAMLIRLAMEDDDGDVPPMSGTD